jgi:hypothetical protein
MEGGAVGHNFERDTPRDHLCQIWTLHRCFLPSLALFGQAVSEEKIFLTLQWAEPLVFLTIVVVQNVPLLMTESSMATGCDVTERDGSDVIRTKVGDSPWV